MFLWKLILSIPPDDNTSSSTIMFNPLVIVTTSAFLMHIVEPIHCHWVWVYIGYRTWLPSYHMLTHSNLPNQYSCGWCSFTMWSCLLCGWMPGIGSKISEGHCWDELSHFISITSEIVYCWNGPVKTYFSVCGAKQQRAKKVEFCSNVGRWYVYICTS